MIEIIQQTVKASEEKTEGKLPRNIRQIGNPEKDFRIYMEDYVYTYLHPAQIQGMQIGILPRLLILLGEINHFSDRSCAFISGAIQVEDSDYPEEVPELNEATWRQIHTEMHRFFDKCEIVGWVLDIPGNTLEVSREMEDVHRRNFVSKYQFFFLMDSREREEAFYTWKDGRLSRKEGYFIYYEKNPQMQEYMISRREQLLGELPLAEDVPDQAARNYRAMMREKKEHAQKQKSGILSYFLSVFMLVVLCSVSVILLGNIRRMEHMEETISVMSIAMESTEAERETAEHKVAVETISGTILPAGADETASDRSEASPAFAETIPDEAPADEPSSTPPETEDVPGEPSAPAEEPDVPTQAEAYRAQGYYIVQKGDSLRQICYSIYQDYAMMDALCAANQIENQDAIFVGQKIVLP